MERGLAGARVPRPPRRSRPRRGRAVHEGRARSPGSSRSAISTFCCVSSPKRSPSRLGRREERDARRDAVGDPFRVDAVTDRFVDAVPSREPVSGRDGRDVRVAAVFCVSGGGARLVWPREEAQDRQRIRFRSGSRIDAGAELEHDTVGRPHVHGVSIGRDDGVGARAPRPPPARGRRVRPSPGPVVLIKRSARGRTGPDSLAVRAPPRAPRRGGRPGPAREPSDRSGRRSTADLDWARQLDRRCARGRPPRPR